jgi:hypothetical protein
MPSSFFTPPSVISDPLVRDRRILRRPITSGNSCSARSGEQVAVGDLLPPQDAASCEYLLLRKSVSVPKTAREIPDSLITMLYRLPSPYFAHSFAIVSDTRP